MKTLIKTVVREAAHIVDVLRPGYTPDEPYICTFGCVITRIPTCLYGPIEAHQIVPCPSKGCTGELMRMSVRKAIGRAALEEQGSGWQGHEESPW